MKTINLNCVFGALAPGINEVESEVADQLIAAGYATLSDTSGGVETVTRDAFDAVTKERDDAREAFDAVTKERDDALAELALAQAELGIVPPPAVSTEANSGKASKTK